LTPYVGQASDETSGEDSQMGMNLEMLTGASNTFTVSYTLESMAYDVSRTIISYK
jgi:hypothetical protein